MCLPIARFAQPTSPSLELEVENIGEMANIDVDVKARKDLQVIAVLCRLGNGRYLIHSV